MTSYDFLDSIEHDFLKSFREGRTEEFEKQLTLDMATLKTSILSGSLGQESIRFIRKKVDTFQHFVRFCLNLEIDSIEMVSEAKERAKQVLVVGCQALRHSPSADYRGRFINSDDSSNAIHFRRWFLENLANPFPSAEVKHQLAEQTRQILNAGHEGTSSDSPSHAPDTYERAQLWFINTRRRSQWTKFARQFASSDKDRMKSLCDVFQMPEVKSDSSLLFLLSQWTGKSGSSLVQHVHDCRALWKQVINWIQQKPKEEAGSWLDSAICEGKKEYKEARRRVKEQHRRVLEHQAQKNKEASVEHEALQSESNVARTHQSSLKRRRREEHDSLSSPSLARKARKLASDKTKKSPSHQSEDSARRVSTSRAVSGSSASTISSLPSLVDPCQTSYESNEGDWLSSVDAEQAYNGRLDARSTRYAQQDVPFGQPNFAIASFPSLTRSASGLLSTFSSFGPESS